MRTTKAQTTMRNTRNLVRAFTARTSLGYVDEGTGQHLGIQSHCLAAYACLKGP